MFLQQNKSHKFRDIILWYLKMKKIINTVVYLCQIYKAKKLQPYLLLESKTHLVIDMLKVIISKFLIGFRKQWILFEKFVFESMFSKI